MVTAEEEIEVEEGEGGRKMNRKMMSKSEKVETDNQVCCGSQLMIFIYTTHLMKEDDEQEREG